MIFCFALLLFATPLRAANSYPLAPPDTSSPRATLHTFLKIMRESRVLLEKDPHIVPRKKINQDRYPWSHFTIL
jgi:hypothetical protein